MTPRRLLQFALLAVAASAQTHPAFDVVSVKQNRSGDRWFQSTPMKAGIAKFGATNITAQRLLALAYRLETLAILGGPDWMESARFDIDAKGGAAPTVDDLLLMLQNLLADRFKLESHWVSKEMPVYSLVVVKGGAKLQTTTSCPPDNSQPCGGFHFDRIGVNAQNQPIANLVRALTDITGRTVVDRTGLTGKYDFVIKFTPFIGRRGGGEQMIEDGRFDSRGTTIFNALPEQLGLKLESGKASVKQLVIDRLEMPSAN